jgi:hypothetical protein
MSGIGPEAEVDEHALLGFDPRASASRALAAGEGPMMRLDRLAQSTRNAVRSGWLAMKNF